jgi:hypothetical protein
MRSELTCPCLKVYCCMHGLVFCSVLRVHMAVVLAFADLKRGCLAVEKIVILQKSRGWQCIS